MKRRRVAIVGAGFSGVALAAQLARSGGRGPDVVLIERTGAFGPGLAYGTKNRAHLLNVRAAGLSAFVDRPDHFAHWLKRRGGGDASTFTDRRRYGAYVRDVLRAAQNARLFGKAVRCVKGEIVACTPAGQGWSLRLANGGVIDADDVVLALGNLPGGPHPALLEAGVETIDPWDATALRALRRGDVLALGTGLTMIDVALTLADRRGVGTIYALSRRGLAPRGHLDLPRPAPEEPIHLPIPLSEAVHEFRREVKRMAARGEPWQLAFDRVRRDTPALWRRLPLDAQRRFLRHLRPWWDVHRHRAAPAIAAKVAELLQSGKLRVLAGDLVAAARAGRMIQVQHRQRGSLVRHRLEVAAVVNCTGANLELQASQDDLIVQLLDDGIAQPHANGRGFDVDGDGRLIDAQGVAQRGLYAIGAITQGAFWECTAVPEIRLRAAALAEQIG